MIPIKLSIQGLYSYQELQEIDFRQLVASSVFGIFGKVGSGKTSLLEAISFALYGKTERLNSQDKLLYNMMNLKSKHLIIDFEFQAGPNEQLYKFVYEAKRHAKKHHEIGPGERRMFKREGDEWTPIGNEKDDVSVLSKQILGLDYENFKRTIIIPQNQFREFLELSPTDRTKMMNQLFKLDQYDLAGRVGKLSKANDEEFSKLSGLMASLEEVTPENIENAQLDVATIRKSVTERTGHISQMEPVEKLLLLLKQQSETLAITRTDLAHWQSQEPIYQKIQQDITQYEQCRLLFQSSLTGLSKLKDKHDGLAGEQQKAQRLLAAMVSRLPDLQRNHASAKLAYENREKLQDQIDELDTVQLIRTSQESVELQNRDLKNLTARLGSQKAGIDERKADRQVHQTTIETLLGRNSDLERLYAVKHWFGLYKPMKKQADDLQAQIGEYEKSLDAIKQRKNDALSRFSPEWADLTLKVLPNAINEALTELEKIEQDRSLTHQQTLLKNELQRYADSLTDGQPCPLCGSVHHPQKQDHSAIGDAVLKSEQALNKVKQRIKEMSTLRLTVKGLETELRGVHENGKRLIRERGDLIEQLTAHEDTFIWPEFSIESEGNVAEAIKQENDQKKQLTDAQEAVQGLTVQLDKAESIYNQLGKEISGIDATIAERRKHIDSQVESLQHYPLSEVANWNLKHIADLRESLEKQYDQTKTAFDEAEKQKNKAEKDEITFRAQVDQLTKQLADLADERANEEVILEKNLADTGLIREQVEQILRTVFDVEDGKKRVANYYDKLKSLQNQVSSLEAALTEQPFDLAELDAVQEELKAVRAEKDELNKELGKAANKLETLEKQWIEKQKHQKRHDELDLRRQDLKEMENLFRKQGFVDYVSSVYLKNLCQSANDRFFRLTNNQLRLELDDRNGFQVRDFMNGGEVRSVKTLSGGQTFQAALSLALALSDNIQHLTRAKQNLFFLDEGFGTLDKDALQTVFKTLKALRTENRVVGIISHVEELQHEVDNYIRAENTENGSRIINSWEE
ncbi:AAA family ATPase [Spirosoma spitsbergense]|uniref:AAA family ATPase n=1 Tax=Spirosoma spitsbergense TaxID=431554 RepID=UPI000363A36F|nr:SMC family ATPase [Spirosoma spitsbergense]